jgi:tripartite-type tricarboxylate transporter receptor subunit TctC
MKSGIAIARGMALVASFYAALCSAQAQPYPSKPIRVIIPFSAGGTADWLFRTISLEMVKTFGQPHGQSHPRTQSAIRHS